MDALLKRPGVVGCKFKKGDYIIKHGEEIKSIYYLAKGSCYRTAFTEKGSEIIYSIKNSSGSFVHSLLGVLILYSDGVSITNFIARTNCDCYKIPKEIFFEYVRDKADILNQILSMAMREYRDLICFYQARQAGTVANFLCSQLLKNVRKEQQEAPGANDYNSIKKLSGLLGVHKVTVAKIFKALREEGVINKDGKNIVILDEKQLARYAKGEETIKY